MQAAQSGGLTLREIEAMEEEEAELQAGHDAMAYSVWCGT